MDVWELREVNIEPPNVTYEVRQKSSVIRILSKQRSFISMIVGEVCPKMFKLFNLKPFP